VLIPQDLPMYARS